ncbi:MAG: efflux RND transporter periplasmic adaptor subunit [Crocosphaera sp.]
MQNFNPTSPSSPEESSAIVYSPQNKQSPPIFWSFLTLSVGGLLLLGIGFWLGSTRQSLEPMASVVAENNHVLPVEVETLVAVNSHQQLRTYTGEIVPQNNSDLGFERGGTIVEILVEEGQKVRTGTPIARLDTRQLMIQKQELLAQTQQAIAQLREMQTGARRETIAAARAKLAQQQAQLQEMQAGPRNETIAAARANLNNLQEQLELSLRKKERRQDLFTQGAISQEQFDEVITEVETQQAKVKESQSRLDELLTGTRPEAIMMQQAKVREAQSQLDELLAGTRLEVIDAQKAAVKQLDSRLKSLELDLEKSVLKAPFAGKISQRYLDQGTAVSSGQSVVRLVQLEQMKAHIGIPASLKSKIKPGEQQRLQIGEKSYQATISNILPEVDTTTGTITVVLNLNEQATQTVAVGQMVTWQLEQTLTTEGYWLPTTALVTGIKGLWSVYVLGEARGQEIFEVQRRDLEILYTDGEKVLVRGTLEGNETIIINGTNRLVPGQKVRPSF